MELRTKALSCELGCKETTEPTGGSQRREYWGGPTNGRAAACRRRLAAKATPAPGGWHNTSFARPISSTFFFEPSSSPPNRALRPHDPIHPDLSLPLHHHHLRRRHHRCRRLAANAAPAPGGWHHASFVRPISSTFKIAAKSAIKFWRFSILGLPRFRPSVRPSCPAKPEPSESPKKAKSRKKLKRPKTAWAACRRAQRPVRP